MTFQWPAWTRGSLTPEPTLAPAGLPPPTSVASSPYRQSSNARLSRKIVTKRDMATLSRYRKENGRVKWDHFIRQVEVRPALPSSSASTNRRLPQHRPGDLSFWKKVDRELRKGACLRRRGFVVITERNCSNPCQSPHCHAAARCCFKDAYADKPYTSGTRDAPGRSLSCTLRSHRRG